MSTQHFPRRACLLLALALLSSGCDKLPGKPPSAEGKWVLIPMELDLQPGGKGMWGGLGVMTDITWTQTGSTVTLVGRDGETISMGGEITPDGQKIIIPKAPDGDGNTYYWQRVR